MRLFDENLENSVDSATQAFMAMSEDERHDWQGNYQSLIHFCLEQRNRIPHLKRSNPEREGSIRFGETFLYQSMLPFLMKHFPNQEEYKEQLIDTMVRLMDRQFPRAMDDAKRHMESDDRTKPWQPVDLNHAAQYLAEHAGDFFHAFAEEGLLPDKPPRGTMVNTAPTQKISEASKGGVLQRLAELTGKIGKG